MEPKNGKVCQNPQLSYYFYYSPISYANVVLFFLFLHFSGLVLVSSQNFVHPLKTFTICAKQRNAPAPS